MKETFDFTVRDDKYREFDVRMKSTDNPFDIETYDAESVPTQ